MAGERRVRVLVAGADERDREAYRVYLERDGSCVYEIVRADGEAEARSVLANQPIDCALLNHRPPVLDALALVASLAGPDGQVAVPVIVLEEQASEVAAVEAMRAGAQDYAARARLTPEGLVRSIRNAIEKVALQRQILRRQAALEASQQEQLEIRDHLISHVSHELRTPLTAIHQFVTILMDEIAGPLAPQQQEYLGIVLRNVRSLRDMIDDLMDATRCDSGKLVIEPCVVRLDEAARESVALLRATAHPKQLSLELECEPDLPPVVADPVRLQQILGNLLDNAIKFSPPGRRIWVQVRRSDPSADFLAVAVRDEGCGIRQEKIPLIFERLHQEPDLEFGSRRGLGLGLYISRELVVSQGGEIWAESELGSGSRFVFTLPVFAVDRLLRRALEAGSLCPGPLCLIAVRLAAGHGSALGEERLSAVYLALQRLVYPGSDIVLPRLQTPGAPEAFHVVARAEPAAADAMMRRLQRSLDPTDALGAAGIWIEVRSEPVPGSEHAADRDAWLAAVSAAIEARLLRASGPGSAG
jgi:signal transduction histidine kinase